MSKILKDTLANAHSTPPYSDRALLEANNEEYELFEGHTTNEQANMSQMGWMATLSSQAGTASGPYLGGTLIQSCAIVIYPDYSPSNSYGTWDNYSCHVGRLDPQYLERTVDAYVAKRYARRSRLRLPKNYFRLNISLRADSDAEHISEEIRDAGATVPRAMLESYMFMMTDIESVLDEAIGCPHTWVFRQAASSGVVVVLNSIPTVLIFAGTLTFKLSTSRQIWAFARDEGRQ
ncbi:hypothetical protein CC80DRAFT_531439 [Byssothecium circinans]|uniref:Uncharacterized protein n=1 Tax=Byssothecium circinans TaxID=147558 RepID=A0A6A5UF90_9PLEO|nr:hypothetical protein CC80DRAFT_531439 [Byssothecium circinans]